MHATKRGYDDVLWCRHTDILQDDTLRDSGVRNYEFVVRTIATVGNYGVVLSCMQPPAVQVCLPADA